MTTETAPAPQTRSPRTYRTGRASVARAARRHHAAICATTGWSWR